MQAIGHTAAVRRVLTLALGLLVLAVPATGVAAPPGVQVGLANGPLLRIVDTDPVTLRGAGFRASERVTVVVRAGARARGRAVANAAGGFTLRLVGVDANACKGFSAVAVGNEGSRAVFKRAPGQCPAP